MQTPTLLLAGALDGTYGELACQMSATLADGKMEIMPNAGHALHLEQPALFAGTVRRFLRECQRNQPTREDRRCQ